MMKPFNKKQVMGKAYEKFAVLPEPDAKKLCINDIHIAPYQREISGAKVKKIVKNFLPRAAGIVLVSYRGGKYYCVDGQHKLAAMKQLGYKTVNCHILTGLDYIEECLYFTILNTGMSKLHHNQLFHGLVEGKDSEALELVGMFAKYRFKYNKNSSNKFNNTIGCVKKFIDMKKDCGMYMVERVLRILRNAWFGDQASLAAAMVVGLKTFLEERVSVDESTLIRALEKNHPENIVKEADRLIKGSYINKKHNVGDHCYHVAKVIEDIYEMEIYEMNNPPVKRGRPRKAVV